MTPGQPLREPRVIYKRWTGSKWVVAHDVGVYSSADDTTDPTLAPGYRASALNLWLPGDSTPPPGPELLLDVLPDAHACFDPRGPEFEALALADNAAVATWPDETAAGRDATQATGGNRPTFDAANAAFNGEPTVHFSGTQWLATASWTALPQPLAVFVVVKFDQQVFFETVFDGIASGNRNALIYESSSSKVVLGNGTLTTNGPAGDTAAAHAFYCEFNGASSKLIRDDGTVFTGTPGTHTLTGLTIGSWYAGFFDDVTLVGDIAGLVLVPRVATSGEITDLFDLAQSRWGTP